jgi:hypothetical protein
MIRLETTNRTATIFFRIVAILFDFKTSLCSDIDSSYLIWTTKFRYSSTALPATTKSQLQQSAKQQLPTAPHVHQIETPHRPFVALKPCWSRVNRKRPKNEYQRQQYQSPIGLRLSPLSTPKLLPLASHHLHSQLQSQCQSTATKP